MRSSVADLSLPGLSTAEEQRRAGLAADERALVFHLETSVKRRLAGYEFQYYLNDFRMNRAAKEAQAEAKQQAEEAARPIHLANAAALFPGGRRHVIHTKYLSYAIDLALDDGGPAVIVRVKGLLAEKWLGDPLSEDDKDAKFLDFEGVEPCATRVAVERLVPITAPDVHVDATAPHVNDEEAVRSAGAVKSNPNCIVGP